jgi:hypothetical protein
LLFYLESASLLLGLTHPLENASLQLGLKHPLENASLLAYLPSRGK